MQRTVTCGELSSKFLDKEVVLSGWVASRRDHGGVIFIDLRDRYGITQIVFDPTFSNFSQAEALRREFVLTVRGLVRARPTGMTNAKLSTGEVEVLVNYLEVLNVSEVPPFEIDDRFEIAEDLRLQYRFLDLRRASVQHNILTRSKMVAVIRDYMNSHGFLDIETPFLTKSTPEGARDYLVPSRTSPGKFFALPQSPQIFKQILMVAGFDKYYQIVRCFRDEDLRADRQPEFTQLDIEMSFPTEEALYTLLEGLMQRVFVEILGVKVSPPFLRMDYQEAMRRFGSDKPDMRFGLELVDVDAIVKKSSFDVFKQQESVQCLYYPADLARKDLDELTGFAQHQGAKGLAWVKVKEGVFEGSIAKYLSRDVQRELLAATGATSGVLFFVADRLRKAQEFMGRVRLELADRYNLRESGYKFLWVVNFPLFEYSDEEQRYVSVHHPFTSPFVEDLDLMETQPARVRSRGYDLVLNGTEVGGGSIRIHRRDVQQRVFRALGISDEEAALRFGFLIDALSYGAPPHGGIALGVDRLAAILTGNSSIREVIAFPKNKNADCLMSGAPSSVYPAQLKELHIKLDLNTK